MAETTTIQKIYDELKVLKKDVTFIKKHMFDPDRIMTKEESKRFEESIKDFKEGRYITISSKVSKKEFLRKLKEETK